MAEALLKLETVDATDNAKKWPLPLLLATTYRLNNSGSKKIIVGLQYDAESKNYLPIIQLASANSSRALEFDSGSWEELLQKIDVISQYFKINRTASNEQHERLKLKDFDIVLTTSYGMKSVIFAAHEYLPIDASFNPKKRKRGTNTSIVMQKTTFKGLKNILICIDEKFRRLERILHEVNLCKGFVYDEVRKFFSFAEFKPENSEDIVRSAIFTKRKYVKDNVLKQFDDKYQNFVQNYYDIVFVEMIVLHCDIFHDELAENLWFQNSQLF